MAVAAAGLRRHWEQESFTQRCSLENQISLPSWNQLFSPHPAFNLQLNFAHFKEETASRRTWWCVSETTCCWVFLLFPLLVLLRLISGFQSQILHRSWRSRGHCSLLSCLPCNRSMKSVLGRIFNMYNLSMKYS